VAGLIAALRKGAPPPAAGELAVAAASSTVQRLGGRPDLTALTS
jgi:ribokinase